MAIPSTQVLTPGPRRLSVALVFPIGSSTAALSEGTTSVHLQGPFVPWPCKSSLLQSAQVEAVLLLVLKGLMVSRGSGDSSVASSPSSPALSCFETPPPPSMRPRSPQPKAQAAEAAQAQAPAHGRGRMSWADLAEEAQGHREGNPASVG